MNEGIVHDICYSLLSRASHDRIAVGTTKLVKLFYLIDCEYYRWHRKTLTEAQWIFYHFVCLYIRNHIVVTISIGEFDSVEQNMLW